jgi:hypothetical protein
MLHFDNAPVHNTEGVQESSGECWIQKNGAFALFSGFCTKEIFLFAAMKQTFAGQHFDTIDDFLMGVEASLGGLSSDFLQIVFQEWVG